jgi:hypothetical protein
MAYFHSPQIVKDGLVLLLDAGNPKSYPGSGTNWKDLSGNGNNGTLTNGPTFSSGNAGSIVFDGIDDLVSTSTNALFESQGAVSIWFNRSTNNSDQRLIRRLGVNTNRFYLSVNQGSVSGVRGNGDVRNANFTYAIGQWVHVVWQWRLSDTLQQIYINGNLNYNGTYVPVVSGGDATFGLGQAAPAETWFGGSVSNVQVYNRLLTAAEVLQNYNATKGRFGL